jgi:hypothetical protein
MFEWSADRMHEPLRLTGISGISTFFELHVLPEFDREPAEDLCDRNPAEGAVRGNPAKRLIGLMNSHSQEGSHFCMKDSASHSVRFLSRLLSRWNAIALVFIFGLLASGPSLFAQSGAGSIQGTVTDSTGAVIPGAIVHAVNQATTIAADAVSNSVGFYQVPGLFTGTYAVTITAPGMKVYKTTIELQVAQNAVINPTMTAG